MRLFGKAKGFRLHVMKVASGTIVAQGLLLLASPILSRVYTPADFGALGVYMFFLSVAGSIACYRYEMAIPLPERDEDAVQVLSLCVLLALFTSGLLAIGVFVARDRLVAWMGAPRLRPYLWIMPISVLGTGLFQGLSSWAIRKQAYGLLARRKVTQAVSQIAVQLGLGFLVKGPLGLMAGDAVGRANGNGALGAMVWREYSDVIRGTRWAGIREAAYRYRRFPLISTATQFINTLNLQLPTLTFAVLYGPTVAGWYAMSDRIFGLPSTIILQSVADVYFGEFARYYREKPEGMMTLLVATFRRMFFIGLPVVVLGCIAGKYLVPILLGSAWTMVGTLMLVRSVLILAQFVFAPISTSLFVLERQDLSFAREVLRIILMLIGLYLPHHLGWQPVRAVLFFSICGALAYASSGVITWIALRRYLRDHPPSAGGGESMPPTLDGAELP